MMMSHCWASWRLSTSLQPRRKRRSTIGPGSRHATKLSIRLRCLRCSYQPNIACRRSHSPRQQLRYTARRCSRCRPTTNWNPWLRCAFPPHSRHMRPSRLLGQTYQQDTRHMLSLPLHPRTDLAHSIHNPWKNLSRGLRSRWDRYRSDWRLYRLPCPLSHEHCTSTDGGTKTTMCCMTRRCWRNGSSSCRCC